MNLLWLTSVVFCVGEQRRRYKMAKTKLKKGSRLVCIPCGREVIVDCCGASATTIWCCGKPMRKASRAKTKRSAKK